MILSSFFNAIGQMPDKRFRRVMFLGIMLTFVLLIVMYALLLGLIQGLAGTDVVIPGIGPLSDLSAVMSWASLFLMIFLSVFLMVPVASAITSLFLDDVAQAVEDKHYPHLAPVPRVPLSHGIRDTLGFLGVLLGANILAFILYIMLPFAAIPIFYGLNGYLLGREYFQIAAMRRLGRKGAIELRKANNGTVWLAGCLMAIPLSIPFVNLIIPILGAATFTHLFHKLNRR